MFYVTNVWWNSSSQKGGYKILATATTIDEAASLLPELKRPWCSIFVRDGSNGKRYCYADLIDMWTNRPKLAV